MPNASRPADAPQPSGAGQITGFPLVGRDVRVMSAIAAGVCSLFAIPVSVELLREIFAPGSEGVDAGAVVILAVGVLFFGLPAVISAVVAIRPPVAKVVIDSNGLRVEGGKSTFVVEWSQLRAVALSVSWPNSFLARTRWRRRFHRRLHVLFAPADAAAELPRNLSTWPDHPDFTRALAIPSSPLTGDEPPIVRDMAEALHLATPEKFIGVLRSTGRPSAFLD